MFRVMEVDGAHARDQELDAALIAELCNRAPDAIALVEKREGALDYVFRYINMAFEQLYQCTRGHTVGTNATPFMEQRSWHEDVQRIQHALEDGRPFRVRRGMRRPDDSFVWIEVHFQPMTWAGGTRWMFITRDVTREKLEHDRVLQLSTAVEQGYEPVVISNANDTDGRWTFSYVNDAFTRVTGYVIEELAGKTWDVLLGSQSDAGRLDTIRAALKAGQQVRAELPYRAKNGRSGIFEVQIQPIRDNATRKYASIVSVFRDVTEVREREKKLEFEAAHDPLTRLYNRRYLERVLETAIAMTRNQPVHAFMFADLDGFKEVNDRLGHDTGDRVLIAAARALESATFQTDALARWGGDEFAALLYHCSLVNAQKTAEHFLTAFRAARDRNGVTASIGVVSIAAGDSISEVLSRADKLCYRAKGGGGNKALAEPKRGDRIG